MSLWPWKRSARIAVDVTSQDFLRVPVNPPDANVDIVAVHGLNPLNNLTAAESTWKVGDKLWLRDFLPTRAPQARVLLFGYNSNAAFGTSKLDVRGQATNLLDRLAAERKDPDRPLIFVCHSLGGLVVKQAIVIAKSDKTFEKIWASTYGIAFFGTPHNGGNHAGIGGMAASIVRAVLGNPDNGSMEVLKRKSAVLDGITESFRPFLEDFQFLSFYETKNFGHTRDLVVTKKSATLGLKPEREKQIGLAGDHSQICRFESEDDDIYKQVADNLVGMIDDAVALRAMRANGTEGLHAGDGNVANTQGLGNETNQAGSGNQSRTGGRANKTNQVGQGNKSETKGQENATTQISIKPEDFKAYAERFWAANKP